MFEVFIITYRARNFVCSEKLLGFFQEYKFCEHFLISIFFCYWHFQIYIFMSFRKYYINYFISYFSRHPYLPLHWTFGVVMHKYYVHYSIYDDQNSNFLHYRQFTFSNLRYTVIAHCIHTNILLTGSLWLLHLLPCL